MDKDQLTDFGFAQVSAQQKTAKVKHVFSTVAARYDVMNDLMSLGLHRAWKRFAINACALKANDKVLDLAAGTADLAARIYPYVKDQGCLFVSDINAAMLTEGRARLENQGFIAAVNYVQANAESLPFADASFSCVTMGFGLRNVTDKAQALAAIFRVLAPGGRFVLLEFSKPTTALLQTVYDAYSFNVVPKLGECVVGDKQSYQYLVESIRMHPAQQAMQTLLYEAGFAKVSYHNLAGGIVAVHKAFKY